jgi:Protein of unknown function (DUF2939)
VFKILSITIFLSIIGALFGFAIGPVWAFYDLRSAAQSEDIKSLSELVAFDDASGLDTPEAPAPSVLRDPVAAAGRFIDDLTKPQEMKATSIDVSSYLTPKGLLALSYGAGANANKVNPAEFAPKPPTPSFLYWSVDRARLGIKSKEMGQTVFSLKRKGLFSWQVTHIGLPNADTLPLESESANSAHTDFGPE